VPFFYTIKRNISIAKVVSDQKPIDFSYDGLLVRPECF